MEASQPLGRDTQSQVGNFGLVQTGSEKQNDTDASALPVSADLTSECQHAGWRAMKKIKYN